MKVARGRKNIQKCKNMKVARGRQNIKKYKNMKVARGREKPKTFAKVSKTLFSFSYEIFTTKL